MEKIEKIIKITVAISIITLIILVVMAVLNFNRADNACSDMEIISQEEKIDKDRLNHEMQVYKQSMTNIGYVVYGMSVISIVISIAGIIAMARLIILITRKRLQMRDK